jgi:hypothetical protein
LKWLWWLFNLALSPQEFAEWLLIRHIRYIERKTTLRHALLLIDESEGEEKRRALAELLSNVNGGTAFLTSSKSGETNTLSYAFSGAAGGVHGLFDDLVANGPEKESGFVQITQIITILWLRQLQASFVCEPFFSKVQYG